MTLLLAFAPGSPAGAEAGGVTQCPECSTAVAKFNYSGGSYVPEYGGDVVTLSNTSASGGDWTSTVPIVWVIVFGGATSGSFSNTGLPPAGAGNRPDISHVLFCAGDTTTTAALVAGIDVCAEAAADVEALPRTGATPLPLVLSGFTALLTGAGMLAASRRRSDCEGLGL